MQRPGYILNDHMLGTEEFGEPSSLALEEQSMIVDFLKTLQVDDVPYDCNGDGKIDSRDLTGIGCFTK